MIQRRTRFRLRKAQERLHIVAALLAAIDAIDQVIALIRGGLSRRRPRRSASWGCWNIDEVQARAILDMQLRKLAALGAAGADQSSATSLAARIADPKSILDSPARYSGEIIATELGEIVVQVRRRAADRRSSPTTARSADEDLIAESDTLVTITRGGYAKRTNTDQYRAQKRGGKGVPRRGAAVGRHR